MTSTYQIIVKKKGMIYTVIVGTEKLQEPRLRRIPGILKKY
jgi:hypothetical protein